MPPQATMHASAVEEDMKQAVSTLPNTLNPKYWYLYGKPYDFTPFVASHPGGRKAILIGQGRECTELFESYHTFLPSDKLLAKYAVADLKAVVDNVANMNNFGSLYVLFVFYWDLIDGCFVSIVFVNEQKLQLAPETVEFTFKENGFYRVLKQRAAKHFKDNKLGTKAPLSYQICGVLTILGMAICTYYGFYKGSIIAAMIHGLLRAMIIVRDTHAASHYAWSYNPTFNQWMYRVSMAFAGSTPSQWTSKHVIAHHISTNISPIDDDTMYPIKRVLPELPRMAHHAFQHIYIWAFYCVTIMMWTLSDFIKFVIGHEYEGTTQVMHWDTADYMETSAVFAFHIGYRWILPFVCLPFWHAMAIFMAAEVTASLGFVLQFVVNHEVESAVGVIASDDLQKPKEVSKMHGIDWGEHQVVTSHNYGVDSPFWLESSGGLNLQIEHHLFPSVHFSHYSVLKKITQDTCKEFNVPYHTSASLLPALSKHYTLLHRMGRADAA